MRYLLAPNAFKGTLTSAAISDLLASAIREEDPHPVIREIPIADGGDGTLDALSKSLQGTIETVTVHGPLGHPIQTQYLLAPHGVAVIEMAKTSGISLIKPNLAPMTATTQGVGDALKRLLSQTPKPKTVYIGLGGSASTDGGCGMAMALGAVFKDEAGNPILPTGKTLGRIQSIDLAPILPWLKGTQIVGLSDVDAPLTGPLGASEVFAPQKGATPDQVAELEANLSHLAKVVSSTIHKDDSAVPGAGAAGGLGFGILSFLNGRLVPGAKAILDEAGFDRALADSDWVITGEGRLDSQTLQGKAVMEVIRRAKRANVPVIALCGDLLPGYEPLYREGLTAAFSTNRVAMERHIIKASSAENLKKTMADIARLLVVSQSRH